MFRKDGTHPEWRTQLGDMGFDMLPPPLGTMFDSDFKWDSPKIWKDISNAKNDEEAMKILNAKMDGLLKNTAPPPPTGEQDTTTLGIPNSALALTGLFLLASEGEEHEGDILLEGDESPDLSLIHI